MLYFRAELKKTLSTKAFSLTDKIIPHFFLFVVPHHPFLAIAKFIYNSSPTIKSPSVLHHSVYSFYRRHSFSFIQYPISLSHDASTAAFLPKIITSSFFLCAHHSLTPHAIPLPLRSLTLLSYFNSTLFIPFHLVSSHIFRRLLYRQFVIYFDMSCPVPSHRRVKTCSKYPLFIFALIVCIIPTAHSFQLFPFSRILNSLQRPPNNPKNPKPKNPKFTPTPTPTPTPSVVTQPNNDQSPFVCQTPNECLSERTLNCRDCFSGFARSACIRYTNGIFNFRKNENPNRPPRSIFNRPFLKNLYKSLQNSKLRKESPFCEGFKKLYVDPYANLSFSDNATIVSTGAGTLFQRILREDNPSSTITVTSGVSYDDDTLIVGTTAPTYEPSNTGDTNQTQRLFEIDMDSFEKRLSGQRRLPVSAEQVVTSSGKLRRWAIIRALRKLTNAADWTAAFRSNPYQFKIVVRDGNVFLVYIGFSNEFFDEFWFTCRVHK